MKKLIVLASLALLSVNAFALTNTKLCEKQARAAVAEAGFDTEFPLNKKFGVMLNPGEGVVAFERQIGPFADKKIVYHFQADERGWFEVAAVMNPNNCALENLIELYVE